MDKVSKMRIELSGVNGPKGGADKRCQIHIALSRQRHVVDAVQADMYSAIDSAMRRAWQALGRLLAKEAGS